MADTSATLKFTQDNFQSTIDAAGDKLVMVDFYAEWCGPCQVAAPIIDKLAVEMKESTIIGKLDVDEYHDLAVQYKVMSIPTVIIFKNKVEVGRQIGFPGEAGYRQMIAKAQEAAAQDLPTAA